MKGYNDIMNFVVISLMIISCSEDTINDVDNSGLSGLYVATTFTEPGAHDGGVDILANNGMLTVQLNKNYTVSGQVIIPQNINSDYTSVNEIYNGSYTLKGDTIRFQNANQVLDDTHLYLLNKDSILETPDYRGRVSGYKIVLEKQ